MRDSILLPTCLGCSAHLLFDERLPKKQNGVLMKPGDRYCLGAKKPIRFGRKDPKMYPPKWCPKRKSPCEVRVYCFRSAREWHLHDMLCRDLGQAVLPGAWNYCVAGECTTDLTPKRFWESLEDQAVSDLLPIRVDTYWVVEIDDGLKPVCFYRTETGFEIVPFFDTNRARKNEKERDGI